MNKVTGKNFLITGGAGFIGSHLVDALISEKPAKIVVVDNFFLGKRENLDDAKKNYRSLKIIEQDATDYNEMKKIISKEKIDVVFNLATKALEYSFVNPDDAFMVNVELSSVLLNLLMKKSYKTLIHCSSSEAYGTEEKGKISESHALFPETLYAAGKAAADLMVRSYYRTYKLDVATVRPFNNYGPRQNKGLYAAIIPITIKRILSGKAPILASDGNQSRDFIYVEDTVRGMIEIYKNNKTRGREINIATGYELKIKDLLNSIMRELHYNGKIIHKPARLADVRRHQADTRLAEKMLHFKPNYRFEEGIKKTIKWYLEKAENEKNSSN